MYKRQVLARAGRRLAAGVRLSGKCTVLYAQMCIRDSYRLIRQEGASVDDLLPLLARMGAQNTGRTLVGLKALRQLGLVQVRRENGARRLASAPVEGKKDLSAAPILKALEA